METQARVEAVRRLTWLVAAILIWGLCIFCRLIALQVVHHQDYARLARQQQELRVRVLAPRGSIFDRNGQPLGLSVPAESVFVNPLKVPDLKVASDILARILKLGPDGLHRRMQSALRHRRGFLSVKRRISPAEAGELRSLRLDWIDFETESQRYYPNGTLAAHILGSVNYAERGNAGLEQSLEPELRGHPGAEFRLTDVKRRPIESQVAEAAQAGVPLTLTIDSRIQFVAEQELQKAVLLNHAGTGSVVVMKPDTGEILAGANYPTFDPNTPPGPDEPSAARFNLGVSVPFEPGSIFKVITLSAALETTSLRPETPINCGNGILRLPGRVIHEARHGYGTLPMAMVLAKSSNIGAIQVGFRVGQQNMYEYVRRFGFGQRTGVPLPAEASGLLRRLNHWGTTSLASVSMGQEISTTSIQLARACAAIANGGLLVKPRLILKRGGEMVRTDPPVRILKPETAITMRRMMEGVVLRGTGTKARLDGYSSGGKTGTAQIFDTRTHRYTHSYNASFMGFAPLTNPAIVVVVTLNGTTGSAGFGGPVAAPVFRAVAGEALRVLDVPKDLPEGMPQENAIVDMNDLSIADLGSDQPNILEDTGPGPKVPNFRGKTMRVVVAEAASLGVPILLDGSGIARAQAPPPGSPLHSGERIRVQFAR